MQPYQSAAEATRNQGTGPINALKTAGKLALNVGGSAAAYKVGSKIMGKALNFLSPYIPVEIAKKGLNKIDPRFGKFVKKAEENGYDFDEISDFIKQKSEGDEGIEDTEFQQQPQDSRNIIEKYSPELHQFIDQEVRNGRPALHAAAIAQNDKRFSDIIRKLTKDYKTNWSNIVEGIYGNEKALQQEQSIPGQQGDARSDLAQAMQQLAQLLQK